MGYVSRILFLAWIFSFAAVQQTHAENHVSKKFLQKSSLARQVKSSLSHNTRSTQATVTKNPNAVNPEVTYHDLDSTVTLTSPGYPTPVQEGYYIIWNVVVPACYVIEIYFLHGDVGPGCNDNYADVADLVSYQYFEHCEGEITNAHVVSAGDSVRIYFFEEDYAADGRVNNHTGTKAYMSFTNVCGPTYPTRLRKNRPCRQQSSTNSSGTQLSSPAGRRGNCRVRAMSGGDGTKVVVKSLNINETASEKLVLFGANKRISVTPSSNEGEYYFPSRFVFVRYSSSTSSRDKAFEIDIIGVDNTCGEFINLAAGNRQISLDIDTDYTANIMCEWKIVAPQGQRVRLDFVSFDMGSCSIGNYVTVTRLGNSNYRGRVKTFCGNKIPKLMSSHGNELRVAAFRKQPNAPGFTINVSSV